MPWGVEGGHDGSPNAVHILHEDGSKEIFGKCARYPLKRGEVARLVTGTGGGWGLPLQRPVEEVVEDVRDGYISIEQARQDYGIELDPETLNVIRQTSERLAHS